MMLCAGQHRGQGPVTGMESLKLSTLGRLASKANAACNIKSAGNTKIGRRASALHMQVNGANHYDITKSLGQKQLETVKTNYADLPSTAAARSLAGWPKTGIPELPRQKLHDELRNRNGEFYPLLVAAAPTFWAIDIDYFESLDARGELSVAKELCLFVCLLVVVVVLLLLLF